MSAWLSHFPSRASLCLLYAACAAAVGNAAVFTHNFQGRGYDPKRFRLTGAAAGRLMRTEQAGLRITLPEKRPNNLPVGLVTHFGVQGDFEITLAFQIIRVDKPIKGTGAGVSLYITMRSPTRDAATVGRMVWRGGEQVFISHRATTPTGGKRQHRGGRPLVSDATTGRLRLVRKGEVLSYQVAPGDGKAFQEVYRCELGTDDLDGVRFAADPGGAPGVVDVYIKSVSIRADGFGAPRAPARPTDYSVFLVVALAVVVVAAVGGWLWWRRRRRRSQPIARDDEGESNEEPAAPPAPSGRALPSTGITKPKR